LQTQTVTKNNTNNALLNLRQLVKNDLDKVDGLIFELIASKISLIPEISEHTISSGGKRMRPILTLASAQICGYAGQAHIGLAACVEFIHTATLLHDDVVDKSDLRRGASTANSLWGNKESILVGDFLLGKAFQLMGEGKSLEIYRILSNAAVVISEGEVMQLAATGNINGGEGNYFKIISAKTAELFAAACEVGGVLAQSDQKKIEALRLFGLNLGIAFQIVDDLLDYYSSDSKMGKNVGDDFREQKVTLPVLIAYKKASAEEKAFWERTIDGGAIDDSDIQTAITYIKNHNVIADVMARADEYVASAKNALNIFSDSSIKSALLDVIDFAIERQF
jgi:octaprenyl-diphosphate synthase